MALSISAIFGDAIAPTAFYPKKNPVKIATGPAGALGGGGWSIDTWATVVQISVAKSTGVFESQIAAPLGGNIPQSPVADVDTDPTRHRWRASWTNSTSLYSIDIDAYKKVSGVWTADWTANIAAGSTLSAYHSTYVGGDQVRFRARYNDGGVLGDWSNYSAAGIIPS